MKKIRLLSLVLALSLIVSYGMPSVGAADVSVDTSDRHTVLLADLGIEADVSKNTVTRGEFATLAAMVAGSLVVVAPNDAPEFEDVKASSSAAKYISAVCNAGIMNGVGNGMFEPGAPISSVDAVVAMVRLAGYDVAAKAYGGYPAGYLRVAADKGITDGIVPGTAPLTGAQMALLAYNTLHTDVYQIVSMGESVEYMAYDGVDVLGVYHDIYMTEALVTANDHTSLYRTATECAKDEIAIDGQRYKITDDTFGDYLGMSVIAYYRQKSDDKIGTVVSMVADFNLTNVLTLDGSEITIDGSDKISYYVGDKLQNVKIGRGFSCIYNGKFDADRGIGDLAGRDTTLTLIDADGDKVYETVDVERGETLIVTNIDRTRYIVYGQNQVVAVYDDSEETSSLDIRDKDGNEVYFDRLKTGNILTVFSSEDGQYIKMVLCTETVKGTITEMDKEEGTVVLTSSKGEKSDRRIATGFESDFVLGLSGEFYLDAFGKLVYSDTKPGYDYRYGYLINCAFTSPMAGAKLQILTSVDFETFECAEAISVDGNAKEAFGKDSVTPFYDGTKAIPQMIRFKTNADGMITFIDTENRGSGDEIADRLTPDSAVKVKGSYTPYFPTISSTCQIAADTLLIKAPGKADTGIAFNEAMLYDTDYYSNTRDALGENKTFNNAVAYELDDTLTPKAIVYYSNTLAASDAGNIDDYSKLAVVMGHINKLDKNGDARHGIRVYTDAYTEEILYFDDKYTDVARDMEFGDIILYLTDANGCISKWAYDYDMSAGDVASNTSSYNSYFTKYVGYPYAKGDNAFSFLTIKNNSELSEKGEFLRVFPVKVMKFIEVDLSEKTVVKSSYEYVESYKHSQNPDNKAFVKVYRGGGNYEDILITYKK